MSARLTTRKLALLDIGQSRPSIPLDPDFAALIPRGWTINTISPLDAYAAASLATLFAPQGNEMPLRSCASTGDDFLASHAKLTPELQSALSIAVDQGADAAIVTCTTDFELVLPETSQIKLILPGRELASAATRRGWKMGERIVVVCPVDGQLQPLAERWRARVPPGVNVQSIRIAPSEGLDKWTDVAKSIKGNGVTLVILDCFGYSLEQGRRIEAEGLEVLGVKGVVLEGLEQVV